MCKSDLYVYKKKKTDLENVISCDLIFWIPRFKVPQYFFFSFFVRDRCVCPEVVMLL